MAFYNCETYDDDWAYKNAGFNDYYMPQGYAQFNNESIDNGFQELDMITNLITRDQNLMGKKLFGSDEQQRVVQQSMFNQAAMVGNNSAAQQMCETNGNLVQSSPQVVMNGARMSSTSSGDDSPPSASPNSTASINSILSHQQQQHHAGLMAHQGAQQHHGNLLTNGGLGGLPGLDHVDITGLLNHQLKTGLSSLYSQHDNSGAHSSAFQNRLLNMQSPNTSSSVHQAQQQIKTEFGSSTSSAGGAAGPIRRHRSSAHDSMQKCQFCPKKYPSAAALQAHMGECRMVRVHECGQCGKRFKARGGLQQHNRIHMQERPYHCHFCPKRFTQKSHVDQHERIHTGAKPFVCTFCGRAFRQRSQQMGHEATHTHGSNMAISQVSQQAGSLHLGGAQQQSQQQQPHGSGMNGHQSDRGSMSDTSCQNSPVAEHPNQILQHAAAMAASSSQLQQQQQNFMDKNNFNAAMLNAIQHQLSNTHGGANQLAADSLLALKQGHDNALQQLISGR